MIYTLHCDNCESSVQVEGEERSVKKVTACLVCRDFWWVEGRVSSGGEVDFQLSMTPVNPSEAEASRKITLEQFLGLEFTLHKPNPNERLHSYIAEIAGPFFINVCFIPYASHQYRELNVEYVICNGHPLRDGKKYVASGPKQHIEISEDDIGSTSLRSMISELTPLIETIKTLGKQIEDL